MRERLIVSNAEPSRPAYASNLGDQKDLYSTSTKYKKNSFLHLSMYRQSFCTNKTLWQQCCHTRHKHLWHNIIFISKPLVPTVSRQEVL